jgi:hypothetical protein
MRFFDSALISSCVEDFGLATDSIRQLLLRHCSNGTIVPAIHSKGRMDADRGTI